MIIRLIQQCDFQQALQIHWLMLVTSWAFKALQTSIKNLIKKLMLAQPNSLHALMYIKCQKATLNLTYPNTTKNNEQIRKQSDNKLHPISVIQHPHLIRQPITSKH